jgi:hypothetical protein
MGCVLAVSAIAGATGHGQTVRTMPNSYALRIVFAIGAGGVAAEFIDIGYAALWRAGFAGSAYDGLLAESAISDEKPRRER